MKEMPAFVKSSEHSSRILPVRLLHFDGVQSIYLLNNVIIYRFIRSFDKKKI